MDEHNSSVAGEQVRILDRLKVKAVLENVPAVTRCVARAARSVGFDEHALYQIELAVDEACANVVDHAYPEGPPGDMEIVCCFGEGALSILVRDWGQGFDPGAVESPDIEAPLADRSLGGLGLFLVRQVMDHVEFCFCSGQGNELTMVKRLEAGE
jgi:serine/threonine-protein kinase RsbW